MIKFSIIIPTKRPETIALTLDSILNNATDKNSIEIVLGVDEGDTDIIGIGNRYANNFNIKTIVLPQIITDVNIFGREVPNIVAYYNKLALNYTEGQYIIPMNDDAIFISSDWDINSYIKLEKHLKDKDDRIVLGVSEDFIPHTYGYDGIKGIPAPLFPIISKEGIKYFGFLFHPKFHGPSADPHIAFEYYKLGKTVDLKDIIAIRHRPEELNLIKR